MAIRNNNIANDDDNNRGSRLLLLETYIDKDAAELGISGDLLAWAQTCKTIWSDMLSLSHVETGTIDESFQEYQIKHKETQNYYQLAKDLLLAIIEQYGTDKEIEDGYGIRGSTSRKRKELSTAIDDFVREHVLLVAAGDPRVLAQTIIDKLVALNEEMNTMWTAAQTQKQVAKKALEAKRARFDEDTVKMRVIYNIARMKWGKQSSNFITLGFLPASMVWTRKGGPPAPERFAYDGGEFHWASIEDVDSYEMQYRKTGTSGKWTTIYEGAENQTSEKPAQSGTYDFRVRGIADSKHGKWSKRAVSLAL